MNKQLENLYAHDRHQLHEVVPLDTPYSVNIEPSSRCNIKCIYCMHSLSQSDKNAQGFSDNYCGGNMTKETYNLLLDQLAEFPHKIKSITFGGVGEPLMNKDLPKMVAELKSRNITDRINLITNGLLLSENTSSELIEAGLSSMKISLQGIDSQGYFDTCGVKIDFDKFLHNLDFLYKHKDQCAIGIKIADISLYRGKSDSERPGVEEEYKAMFSDKCDKLGIEHIVPCFTAVDYNKVKGMSGHKSRYNIVERSTKVCSQPFYRINIMQNGCVTLCTMLGLHDEWMNIHTHSLKEIWNSNERKEILLNILHNNDDASIAKCQNCNIKYDFAYSEDNLDPYVNEIADRIIQIK